MPIFKVLHLLFSPRGGWQAIKQADFSVPQAFLGHTVLFPCAGTSALPAPGGAWGWTGRCA